VTGHETEAKLAVTDPEPVRQALLAAGAVPLGSFLQTDRFFDWPDGPLRRADSALRLRTVRRLDGSAGGAPDSVLTYKGPQQASGGAARLKVRREVETAIGDAEAAAEILQAAGLRRAVTVQKRRASWQLGSCRVELDELPLLGCFVEVEGPDEPAIVAALEALALASLPRITKSYLHLLADREAAPLDGREFLLE